MMRNSRMRDPNSLERRFTQADHYCLSAGISVAGVLALNLSRRDKNRADSSANPRAGSLLGQVEVRISRADEDEEERVISKFSWRGNRALLTTAVGTAVEILRCAQDDT